MAVQGFVDQSVRSLASPHGSVVDRQEQVAEHLARGRYDQAAESLNLIEVTSCDAVGLMNVATSATRRSRLIRAINRPCRSGCLAGFDWPSMAASSWAREWIAARRCSGSWPLCRCQAFTRSSWAPWRDADELTKWVDVGRAARQVDDRSDAVAAFARADLAYDGKFLADHPFDEWAAPTREHFRVLHREAATALLGHHLGAKDYCALLQLSSRLLSFDPADEDACRYLMMARVALGQPHLASMAFAQIVETVRDRYGVHPAPDTVALVVRQ